jgi:hypothetical protein
MDRELLSWLMALTLIGLGVADVVAFALEWRTHRKWTRTAVAESVGLALLVILGLGDWYLGELNTRHEQVTEQQARTKNDALHAELAAARSEANRAHEESKLAQVDSEAAHEEATQLRKDVAPILMMARTRYPNFGIREALAQITSDLEGAKKNIQVEREARIGIENRLALRHVSTPQRAEIVKTLRPHSVSTVLLTRLGDKEASDYATEIIQALFESGWHVVIDDVGLSVPPSYGLQYKSDSSTSGKALSRALSILESKVNVALEGDAHVPNAVAIVFVGLKPPS